MHFNAMRISRFLTCEQRRIPTFFLWSFSILLLLESIILNTLSRVRIIFTHQLWARTQSNQVRTHGMCLIIN
ncbi:hypothetical protein EUGRSUZ_L00302 [Eucalyptus grandis]|uniref:Uncharacterized protein n=1 Tax=Eucalyptus grandis TaxID=71139 RepID=A0A058ZVM9_EUCGR|nr:hypothetical protein EUGRSUZ_L00302 [Eucalyptus grandis]